MVAASGWLQGVDPNSPAFVTQLSGAVGKTRRPASPPWAGAVNAADPLAARAARDNITNHDLITK
jgi:hypothetical protein